jgi:hypothetical protein
LGLAKSRKSSNAKESKCVCYVNFPSTGKRYGPDEHSTENQLSFNRTIVLDILLVLHLTELPASMSSAPMPELPRTNEGKRICQVIKVKPEALDEYKKVYPTTGPSQKDDSGLIR